MNKKYLKYYNISFFLLNCFLSSILLSGCYSFTGGSVPEHLKTISIPSVKDISGYGDPRYKDKLTQSLIQKFQNDNSLKVVDLSGDAKLTVTIDGVKEESTTTQGGKVELEKERKLVINCSAIYFDNVKKKKIWEKKFNSFQIFSLTNLSQSRLEAAETALGNIADDILISVVSGW